ncbi:zinc finger BED domain-containing protein 4-like [Rhizophagus clarus]|uniref:Zinc finger BED domain-containing protein 4-like n=1 Tax=Rhizophagus clarus TaxID=94130 RepID=A0A8H3KV28_9GLOM|nr:zinc finger BED domain-containing protein 4-like [Rhizophagus clarus]
MNSKDYSTSNYIAHLNTVHDITKEMHDQKMKEQQVIQQSQIDTMFCKIISNNPQRKIRLDQKFIGILVKDLQPFSIHENEGFLEFIYELDSLYQLPSEKRIFELLTNGYNNTKTF